MADWASNHLVINGPPRDVDAFLDACGASDWAGKELSLDFDALVPVPDEVKDPNPEHLSNAEDHWRAINWGCKWAAEIYDLSRPLRSVAVLDLNTPYSPPLPWLRRAAPQYPQLTLHLTYKVPKEDEEYKQTWTITGKAQPTEGLCLYTLGADSSPTKAHWQSVEQSIAKLTPARLDFGGLLTLPSWDVPGAFDVQFLQLMQEREELAPSQGRPQQRPKSKRRRPTRSQAILDLIVELPGISASDIAKTIKIKPNYLYRILADFEQSGSIRRNGRKYFVASGSVPDDPIKLTAAAHREGMDKLRQQLKADLSLVRREFNRATPLLIRRGRQWETAHIFGRYGRASVKRLTRQAAERLKERARIEDDFDPEYEAQMHPVKLLKAEVGQAFNRLTSAGVLPTRQLRI